MINVVQITQSVQNVVLAPKHLKPTQKEKKKKKEEQEEKVSSLLKKNFI